MLSASTSTSGPGLVTTLGNGYDDGVQSAKDNYPSSSEPCPAGGGIAYCLAFGYGYNHEFSLLQQAGVSP
jgi:hypothetical protein